MTTAYARKLGTARHLKANGRTWTIEGRKGTRELVEVCRFEHGDNPHSYIRIPPALGFAALDTAAYWRKLSMVKGHHFSSDERVTFKRRCFESIQHSREMRVTRELRTEAREAREIATRWLDAAE